MAIKYKELKDKLKYSPLTPEELQLIAEAEEFIDAEILKSFGVSHYGIQIDLTIPYFEYSPKEKRALSLKSQRRDVMRKELEMRYKKAGWKISIHIDDGLDGPNMSGPDYWILNGK